MYLFYLLTAILAFKNTISGSIMLLFFFFKEDDAETTSTSDKRTLEPTNDVLVIVDVVLVVKLLKVLLDAALFTLFELELESESFSLIVKYSSLKKI